MNESTLSVSAPPSHTVYVDSDGELYGDPLAGTVQIACQDLSPLGSLQVALVRTVRLYTNSSTTGNKSPSRLKSRLSVRKPKRSGSISCESSSFVQEVIRCNLSTTPGSSTIHPDGIPTHNFDFALTSPVHTPETIPSGTTLDVSYELVASATALDSHVLVDSRPLRLVRRRFPDPWDIATHSRSFPDSPLKSEIVVSPQLAGPGPCTRYLTDIQLRNIASPGTRRSELTLLVVESLSWHLDEITTQTTKNPESTTTHSRTLARGTKKGRWTAPRKPRALLSEQSIKDMRIAVPVEINIGKDVNTINDIDIDAEPGSTAPSISVRHMLTVEMVTGTETVSLEDGSLVARRTAVRGFGATVPVPMHSYADTTDVLRMLEGTGFGMLPRYEKVAMAPPEYREVVGPV